MNQCHFLGNLTRDPELRTTSTDKKVVSLCIAVNRKFKRGTEMVQEPAFLEMEAWDSGAELIDKYFKKGDPIIVHCSVRQDSWEDKDTGQKRSRLKFRINSFEFVPGSRKKDEGDTSKPAAATKRKPAAKSAPADAEGNGNFVDSDVPAGEDIPF
jgi:single-strand DNA-binding protein